MLLQAGGVLVESAQAITVRRDALAVSTLNQELIATRTSRRRLEFSNWTGRLAQIVSRVLGQVFMASSVLLDKDRLTSGLGHSQTIDA